MRNIFLKLGVSSRVEVARASSAATARARSLSAVRSCQQEVDDDGERGPGRVGR